MSRDYSQILIQLRKHEGFRSKPYYDTVGKLTVGYGRNIDDKPLTRKELDYLEIKSADELAVNGIAQNKAYYLLIEDMKEVVEELFTNDWYMQLDTVRQDVCINMMYNLGVAGFYKFKNTIKYISQGNYVQASRNMLKSKWAGQVGNRAVELAKQMRTGKYQ